MLLLLLLRLELLMLLLLLELLMLLLLFPMFGCDLEPLRSGFPRSFAAEAICLPKLSKSCSVTRGFLTKPSIAFKMTLSIAFDVPYCIRNFFTNSALSFSLFWMDRSFSRLDSDMTERFDCMFERTERTDRFPGVLLLPDMFSLGILMFDIADGCNKTFPAVMLSVKRGVCVSLCTWGNNYL